VQEDKGKPSVELGSKDKVW